MRLDLALQGTGRWAQRHRLCWARAHRLASSPSPPQSLTAVPPLRTLCLSLSVLPSSPARPHAPGGWSCGDRHPPASPSAGSCPKALRLSVGMNLLRKSLFSGPLMLRFPGPWFDSTARFPVGGGATRRDPSPSGWLPAGAHPGESLSLLGFLWP